MSLVSGHVENAGSSSYPAISLRSTLSRGNPRQRIRKEDVCLSSCRRSFPPNRQRQVMASPAMGSQAYRFTGWGKTLSLVYVSRSVGRSMRRLRDGWGRGRRRGFHESSRLHQSVGMYARTCPMYIREREL